MYIRVKSRLHETTTNHWNYELGLISGDISKENRNERIAKILGKVLFRTGGIDELVDDFFIFFPVPK